MQVATADRTTKTDHTELHMWREIHSQPEVAALNLGNEGGRLGRAAAWIAEQGPQRLHFAGSGDSRFTGMVGRYAMSPVGGDTVGRTSIVRRSRLPAGGDERRDPPGVFQLRGVADDRGLCRSGRSPRYPGPRGHRPRWIAAGAAGGSCPGHHPARSAGRGVTYHESHRHDRIDPRARCPRRRDPIQGHHIDRPGDRECACCDARHDRDGGAGGSGHSSAAQVQGSLGAAGCRSASLNRSRGHCETLRDRLRTGDLRGTRGVRTRADVRARTRGIRFWW